MTDSIYGYCPKCGARGQQRERRPNGNDVCVNGCVYPSAEAVTTHNSLGYCPKCSAPGIRREKRPDGNDECEGGCLYPSSEATDEPTTKAKDNEQ